MNSSPFTFSDALLTLTRKGVLMLAFIMGAAQVRAVTITLWTNAISMPEGRTFQMPITASDPDGQPLRFGMAVSKKKTVTGTFAPASNPSLVLNVSGVDSNDNPFTGDMVLQLFQDLTPLTTARMIAAVNSNVFNGQLFQRVVQDFVVQEGDSIGDGGIGTTFDDEYVTNLTYTGFGQLGLAKSTMPDDNNGQFFITDVDLSVANPLKLSPEKINFQNTIFGQLTEGFDVLAELISTPVGPDPNTSQISFPLSNCVINAATIITNSQDGVLRLTAAPKFLGTVTVTVSATNAENQFTSETFTVTTIPETNNSPAILGPIPVDTVVTQNTAATFILKAYDIDRDQVGFQDAFNGSFASLTNLTTTFNGRTDQVWYSPEMTLTGAFDIIIGAGDGTHALDTQVFTLTFLPWSAMPTMSITSMKGTVENGSKLLGDSVKVSGTFAFIGESDGTFSSNDVVTLTLGNPATPLQVQLVPGSTGYKFSKGAVKVKEIVTNQITTNTSVSAQFDGVKKTFKIEVSKFNFPTAITSNQVELDVAVGNDYTSNVVTWVEKKPGMFVPPAP
jgi:cyclophilin family peptidyl-prolyl cis-trans isomerase